MKIIGKLYEVDTTDPENPTSTLLDGWHVNSLVNLQGLEAYLVKPDAPKRLYAGVLVSETFFYSFPDKATADELLAPFLPTEE